VTWGVGLLRSQPEAEVVAVLRETEAGEINAPQATGGHLVGPLVLVRRPVGVILLQDSVLAQELLHAEVSSFLPLSLPLRSPAVRQGHQFEGWRIGGLLVEPLAPVVQGTLEALPFQRELIQDQRYSGVQDEIP